jgi:hypothetical protein
MYVNLKWGIKPLVIPLFLLASMCNAQSQTPLSVTLACEGTKRDTMPNPPTFREPYTESSVNEIKVFSFKDNKLVAVNGYNLSDVGVVFNCDIAESVIDCVATSQKQIIRFNRVAGTVSWLQQFRDVFGQAGHTLFDGVCKVGTRQF